MKYRRAWLQQEEENPIKKNDEQPNLNDYKEPGYVEVINNRIYFYADIDQSKILHLIKTIKEKEDEMIVKQRTWLLDAPPTIHLHIQSYGGYVHAGMAAYDHIKNLKVPVHTYVDGVSASAATLLNISGVKRFIYKNAFMLIHQISYAYWGTFTHENLKDEMQNSDNLMTVLKKIYLESTGIPEKKLNELLKKDLYFTAEDCLKYNLVDSII